MERNNRKKYIHIDRETGSNEIYAMLDEIESDTESDIENLLEDSDTEYISEKPIPDNKEAGAQLEGGEGRSPLPFFKNWKKSALIWRKNAQIVVICGYNFSFKMKFK